MLEKLTEGSLDCYTASIFPNLSALQLFPLAQSQQFLASLQSSSFEVFGAPCQSMGSPSRIAVTAPTLCH